MSDASLAGPRSVIIDGLVMTSCMPLALPKVPPSVEEGLLALVIRISEFHD